MRIGIDARCLCEARYSGISTYTHHLLTHLVRIDQKNQYVLFYNAARAGCLPDVHGSNVTHRAFRYPNKLFNLSLRFLKFAALDKLLGGVDVFITPSFLFTHLSSDCRKVLIVHDLSFEYYPEFFTFKKRLWHALINPRQMTQAADHIIAISQNTKRDIIARYHIASEKIKVIYQAIADVFFEPITDDEKERVRKTYNLPASYLLYLGNLEPRKNVGALLEAFDCLHHQGMHLLIAGQQAWKYAPLYQRWQRLKNKKNVNFLGYVPEKDKPALYAQATLFIYPSLYEGFGLPPLEAMACGTPVITSAHSSLVESVGDAGLLIDPHNINDLAQTIDHLLDDRRLQTLLVQKGRQQSAKFRWERTSQQILDIITT